jgi:RsiW-degrading membrane proteinase PrsW (M82 family)
MKLKALTMLAMLLLLCLPAGAHAQATGDSTVPASVFSGGSLEVAVGQSSFTLGSSPDNETITFTVLNPTGAPMDVYLAVYQGGQWNVLEKLGSIGAHAKKSYSYRVPFTYSGKTSETDRFGVVGRTSDGYLGAVFSITENWSKYVDALQASLSFFGVLSAAILLLILGIIMAGVLSVALRARYGAEGEYTLKTLFFPITRMRPWAERIADIVINPFFWLIEMGLGAVLVVIILFFALLDIRPDIGLLVFGVGGVAAVFMPVVFLVIGWLADYYDREPFRFILGMFMWGVMATFFAFFINTTLSLVLGIVLGTGFAEILLAVLIAPVVEETAKGMGVLILSGHHDYDGVFDGILYGFAIGMGFAFVENWLYFATNASPAAVGGLADWTSNILYRSFLCSLAHGCFTAATGGIIGFVKVRRHNRGFEGLGFFLGLPLAILLHGTFNLTALVDSVMQSYMLVPVPLFDPILTIVITVIYICLGIYLQLKMKNKIRNHT